MITEKDKFQSLLQLFESNSFETSHIYFSVNKKIKLDTKNYKQLQKLLINLADPKSYTNQ